MAFFTPPLKTPKRRARSGGSRRLGSGIVFLALLVLALAATVRLPQSTSTPPSFPDSHAPEAWQVYFSPDGGCTDAIIEELKRAKKNVRVQAYSFTSAPIAQALLRAHKRGVKVEVILDKSQETGRYSSGDFLKNGGIPTFTDNAHAIAHNKVILIDHETVITGSFNFSKAAEQSNSENLLIIRSASLAARYRENWQQHFEHSAPYRRLPDR